MIRGQAGDAAAALLASLTPEMRAAAGDALDELLAWSGRRGGLLTFSTAGKQSPQVRFDTGDGRAFWLACGTTGGDAKVELLTRTARDLPVPIVRQLCDLLTGLAPAIEPGSRSVLQIPMERLATAEARAELRAALDFGLGAVTALASAGVGAHSPI